MTEEKNTVRQPDKKPLTKPGDIKGKLDIPDTRERRDGPGGN